MPRCLPSAALAFLLGLSLLAVPPSALRAEPYLAVRYGYKCSQCHFNPTGGGKRSRFGNIFAQTEMPRWTVSPAELDRFLDAVGPYPAGGDAAEGDAPAEMGEDEPALDSTFYSGYLTSFLSLGGDFRFNQRTVFRNAADDTSNTFEVSEGQVYASVELLEGALGAYLDETVAPGSVSAREAFGILRGPWNSWLKAGRMLLPFGLRLEDDTAFIRELSGFNFGTQDVGAELGFEPGPFSVSAAVSNGSQGLSDDDGDKQFTASASFVQRYWRLGAHGTWNDATTAERVGFGGFAGLNLGFIELLELELDRLTLLGELDYLEDELEVMDGETTLGRLLLYGAVNYEVLDGVNLKFAYDFADPDTSLSGDSFIRASAGVEYTVTQFVQLRAFYRFRDDIETSPRDDEGVLDFEIHLFF